MLINLLRSPTCSVLPLPAGAPQPNGALVRVARRADQKLITGRRHTPLRLKIPLPSKWRFFAAPCRGRKKGSAPEGAQIRQTQRAEGASFSITAKLVEGSTPGR